MKKKYDDCLVLIPARGGSKGIPKKNIKLFNNLPLILHTTRIAIEIFNKKNIIVSTDSNEIRKVVENDKLNVPFLRPNELAKDESGIREVILHAINYYESKNKNKIKKIILLQPTSPLRDKQDIINALSIYDNGEYDMVSSVKETKSNPYFVLYEEEDSGYLKKVKKSSVKQRQLCPKVWELNGAVFIINKLSIIKNEMHLFNKIGKSIMSEDRSVDIDDYLDWQLAELISKQ